MRGPSKENRSLNPDFRDMLSAFIAERVEFLLVGAYALAAHGVPRATGRPKDIADVALLEEAGGRDPHDEL